MKLKISIKLNSGEALEVETDSWNFSVCLNSIIVDQFRYWLKDIKELTIKPMGGE